MSEPGTAPVPREAELAAEAQRQAAFMAACEQACEQADLSGLRSAHLRERGDRAIRGLDAYRANADAIAGRALANVFPTVQKMVGEADFVRLACEFRAADPPVHGDLGEWGGGFPDFARRHAALTAWPWLGDCARVDLAVHRNERAADAALDVASFSLLQSVDPSNLRLVWMPGSALLRSEYPIVTILRAHRSSGIDAEAGFAEIRRKLAEQGSGQGNDPRGETVLVVREGWRAAVHELDATEARWTQCLLNDEPLSSALAGVGDGFDFSTWLAKAVGGRWLQGVVRGDANGFALRCGAVGLHPEAGQ